MQCRALIEFIKLTIKGVSGVLYKFKFKLYQVMYLGRFFFSGTILQVIPVLQKDIMNIHSQQAGNHLHLFVLIFPTMVSESLNSFGIVVRFTWEIQSQLPRQLRPHVLLQPLPPVPLQPRPPFPLQFRLLVLL